MQRWGNWLLQSREELKQPEHCALPPERPQPLSTLNHIFPANRNTGNIKKTNQSLLICFFAEWGSNLPPCRACSLRPMSWPQSPPGGRWCRSRTFSLGPECWWEHWRASRLQVDTTAGQQMRDAAGWKEEEHFASKRAAITSVYHRQLTV